MPSQGGFIIEKEIVEKESESGVIATLASADPLFLYAQRALSSLDKGDFELRNSSSTLIKRGSPGARNPFKFFSFDNETTLPFLNALRAMNWGKGAGSGTFFARNRLIIHQSAEAISRESSTELTYFPN